MRPFLVSRIIAPAGGTAAEFSPEVFGSPVAAPTAAAVGAMMQSVVAGGTGAGAALGGIAVAGKTGTAENPHGASHSWFIGYAPADNPVIAIAVIAENAGAGSAVATPVARQVLARALR